jgi:hypothetical protein
MNPRQHIAPVLLLGALVFSVQARAQKETLKVDVLLVSVDAMWGEMTSQEMMLPWFGVIVDRAAQPDKIASYRPGDFDGIVPRPPSARPRSAVPVV